MAEIKSMLVLNDDGIIIKGLNHNESLTKEIQKQAKSFIKRGYMVVYYNKRFVPSMAGKPYSELLKVPV